MTISQETIVIVNEEERITTSIDAYFRHASLIFEFDDTYLQSAKTFPVAGYETYTSLADVLVMFPTTTNVYKYAKAMFDQRVNTGVNKSAIEKITVIQTKSTDADYEAGLNRVNFIDAYWNCLVSNIKADIISADAWITGKRKMGIYQSSDADLLTTADTDVLTALNTSESSRAGVWYHSVDTEGLAASIASIVASSNPGDRATFYKAPTGITVGSLTSSEQTNLTAKYGNMYIDTMSDAGSYSARNLTINGFVATGTKVQRQYQVDRIVLELINAGMDALVRDIPYDDRGGTILFERLDGTLRELKNETIISADSVDSAGDITKGYLLDVLTVADTKLNYSTEYAQQKFVSFVEAVLALTAEKVVINLTY